MAYTVAQIAARAFTAVAARITDAIHDASLSDDAQGAYDTATGVYAITTTTAIGRAVVASEKAIPDIFPAYIAGPADELILLEGFTACRENMRLTFAGWVRTVTQVQDIVNAGSLFYVVARKVSVGANEQPSLVAGPGDEW